MKRVLLVSYIFPPMIGGGAPRLTQFCKYLPDFGWATTVLTVPYAPGTGIDEQALDDLPEAVEVVRAYCPLLRTAARGKPNPRRGLRGFLRGLKRKAAQLAFVPDWQIVWYPFAVKAGSELLSSGRFDAVMASYGPATNLLIGARLAGKFSLPLVLDFRDLWADVPAPVWPTPLHRALCRRLERRVVGRATKVIGVSDHMAQHLRKRHALREPDAVAISNGFDPADLRRVADRRRGAARPLTVCFTGSVYGPIDFAPLFEALARLAAAGAVSPEGLRLRFVGNMTLEQPRRWGVEEFVEIHGPVPHHEVFSFFADSDALMLVEPPGYCAQFGHAAKLFDYLLSGKPVLALVEPGSNTERIIDEMGYGWTAPPRDGAAIERVLLELLAERPAFRPVALESEPWRRFDRRRLAGRLAEVLDSATETNPRSREAASHAGV